MTATGLARRAWASSASAAGDSLSRAWALAVLAVLLAPGAALGASCSSTHWVGVWSAAPSNQAKAGGVDGSLNRLTAAKDDTTRAILTPTLGGSTVRVRLSNRFGSGPVTFGHVTIARRASGAALVTSTVRAVRFGGRAGITVRAGADVVSDAVRFSFKAGQTLAVDVFVRGDAGMPTVHYSARQTSFLSPDGSGDHAGEPAATAFTERTTTRPFVAGLDAKVPAGTGAVLALGDSATDGYNGIPFGAEERSGVDADGRYTDYLGQRLRKAHRGLSVLNMGITGDTVLREASATQVPSALVRLDRDVLKASGVSTVIWMEGLNDVQATPSPSVDTLIAGWKRGIRRMRARGLRVLMGTLPPVGSADTRPDATEDKRRRLNRWIRAGRGFDGVVDFDAALRNPALPNTVRREYQGSDLLHLNLAGNRAMANAVKLRLLKRPCR